MAQFTKNPTSNVSPDPAQGGNAVTNPVNTGHDPTTISRVAVGTTTATCKWTGFAAVSGLITSVQLKFDWSEDGIIAGGGTSFFRVQYSTDGGSGQTNVFSHANVNATNSGSSSVTLSNGVDLTQVQVRDTLSVTGGGVGNSAQLTGGVSNIRIEVTTSDGGGMVLML